MRYANRDVLKTKLVVGSTEVPVLVSPSQVIDLRDRRGHYEGYLWSTEMPTSIYLDDSLKNITTLVFPNGITEPIRILDTYWEDPDPESGTCSYFAADFISSYNYRETNEHRNANREKDS